MLTNAYNKTKVVTQMGNQGHSMQGWRIAYELIKGGSIGAPSKSSIPGRTVPCGLRAILGPPYSDKVPENLDWDSWDRTRSHAPPYVAKYRDGEDKGKDVYHRLLLAWGR